jgi:hypothetical protein
MSVELKFLANGYTIQTDAGSGLAFFGDGGFSQNIRVGDYNGRTYIASSDGVSQGPEADNCKWVSSTGVVLGTTGSGLALTQVPNDQATVQIQVNSDTVIQVPTITLYGYDRVSINNAPSGMVLKAFEVIHPTATQTNNGSGDTTWTTLNGSGTTLSLAPSPGSGGLYAGNGSNSTWSSLRHDWFVGLSVSPSTVGSKLAGCYVSVEFNS